MSQFFPDNLGFIFRTYMVKTCESLIPPSPNLDKVTVSWIILLYFLHNMEFIYNYFFPKFLQINTKTVKKQVLTSIWSAQHQNPGQNIHQCGCKRIEILLYSSEMPCSQIILTHLQLWWKVENMILWSSILFDQSVFWLIKIVSDCFVEIADTNTLI